MILDKPLKVLAINKASMASWKVNEVSCELKSLKVLQNKYLNKSFLGLLTSPRLMVLSAILSSVNPACKYKKLGSKILYLFARSVLSQTLEKFNILIACGSWGKGDGV